MEQPCSTFTEPNSVYSHSRSITESTVYAGSPGPHFGKNGCFGISSRRFVADLSTCHYMANTVGLLVTLAVVCAFFNFDPDTATPVWIHLTAGAGIFAAFFILTDPVLARQVRKDDCGLRSELASSHTSSGRMDCIQMRSHLRCY